MKKKTKSTYKIAFRNKPLRAHVFPLSKGWLISLPFSPPRNNIALSLLPLALPILAPLDPSSFQGTEQAGTRNQPLSFLADSLLDRTLRIHLFCIIDEKGKGKERRCSIIINRIESSKLKSRLKEQVSSFFLLSSFFSRGGEKEERLLCKTISDRKVFFDARSFSTLFWREKKGFLDATLGQPVRHQSPLDRLPVQTLARNDDTLATRGRDDALSTAATHHRSSRHGHAL